MYDELSEADIQKMKEEIEHRKVVVRKEALAAVKEAREQGDLSENFEYQAAKREKNRNESRIRYLERMVKTAKVIKDHSKDDEVGLNNTVTVYFEDEDEEETYRIVTTVREDVLHGLISIDSTDETDDKIRDFSIGRTHIEKSITGQKIIQTQAMCLNYFFDLFCILSVL